MEDFSDKISRKLKTFKKNSPVFFFLFRLILIPIVLVILLLVTLIFMIIALIDVLRIKGPEKKIYSKLYFDSVIEIFDAILKKKNI